MACHIAPLCAPAYVLDMANVAPVTKRSPARPILFSSFGNMEHVLHDADRLIPILFKDEDISFLANVKEVVHEHTQEYKWKSIILNISKGMARQELDTFINFKPPHVGPVVLDATAHTPEHEVFYDDALLLARKERLIRLNDTTKDAMYLLYGIHSLPTPLQLGLGMARFYYMGVTIDRLLEIEADIDANTDEPSYRSGLKKALGATLAAHSIYNNDSPFKETHSDETARLIAIQAQTMFAGLATAYAATQVPELKAQISSMMNEMKTNPELFKNKGFTIDGRPNHVNTIAENAFPPKDMLNEVATNPAALIAAENNPQATAFLLNSTATSDAVHRSPYLTDALEDNTETQNLIHNNPANHHPHTFELEQPHQPQPGQQHQAQARSQPQPESRSSATARPTIPRTDEAVHHHAQEPAREHGQEHGHEQPHEYPSIPLLHETNRYSEIKAITAPDESAETAHTITTQPVSADTTRHIEPAAHHPPEHYEAYATEHEQELPRHTRAAESIVEKSAETQEQPQQVQPERIEQPEHNAQEHRANTHDSIAEAALHAHSEQQQSEPPDRQAQDARTEAQPYDTHDHYVDENINERRDPHNGETQLEARHVQRHRPAEEIRREDVRRDVERTEAAREQTREALIDENARAMRHATEEAIERTRHDAKEQSTSREEAKPTEQDPKPEIPDFEKIVSDSMPEYAKHPAEGRDERRLEERRLLSNDAETDKAVRETSVLNEKERQIAAQDKAERNRIAQMHNVAEREAIDLAEGGFVTSATPKQKKDDKNKKTGDEPHPHHPDDTPKPEPT